MNIRKELIAPSRGRIIKSATSASRGTPVPEEHSKASASTRPKRSAISGQHLVRLVLVPLLFCISAIYSASRSPEGKSAVALGELPRHDARYKRLGDEYTRRFSIKPLKLTQKALPNISPPTVLTPPNKVTVESQGDDVAKLERQVYRVLKRYGKPVLNGKELASAIVREAIEQDYDPVFVAAVIKSESAFNSLARSNKGAQGLMQIMPATGKWLADKADIPRRKLTDPGHNLKLGITYLKELEAEYGGNRVLTLIAYNWGPGHVASASKGGRRVPGEVMQYAIKILNDYRRWSHEVG